MSETRHHECRTQPAYFAMFLGETQKPCRGTSPPKPPGMGDWLARFFAWLGIKKHPGCNCEKRQAWFNRLGERIARILRLRANRKHIHNAPHENRVMTRESLGGDVR
jgi:hypothetical protein